MLFQTTVIASGSKGNCVLLQSQETALLLDAGVSMRRILDVLDIYRIPREKLAAVIVSHEHSDHIRSVGALSRKLKLPIYINHGTLSCCGDRLGNVGSGYQLFTTGSRFQIGNIVVEAFASSHDAADSCNFVFFLEADPTRKLGVATDLGYPTQLSLLKLSGVSTLILESNHDEIMLREGPYDWHLKQRIKSPHGHLSNDQAVGLISRLIHPGLKNLVLAHLSEINNHPDVAKSTMESYLASIRADINLIVARQDRHTMLLDV